MRPTTAAAEPRTGPAALARADQQPGGDVMTSAARRSAASGNETSFLRDRRVLAKRYIPVSFFFFFFLNNRHRPPTLRSLSSFLKIIFIFLLVFFSYNTILA